MVVTSLSAENKCRADDLGRLFFFVVCCRLQATATHRKNKPPAAIAMHPLTREGLLAIKSGR